MVLHILKGDPTLRDLEHVQVDGPGTAYLFFYDKQGCRGLKQDATETLQAHVAEAFSKWISHCSFCDDPPSTGGGLTEGDGRFR